MGAVSIMHGWNDVYLRLSLNQAYRCWNLDLVRSHMVRIIDSSKYVSLVSSRCRHAVLFDSSFFAHVSLFLPQA